MKHLFLILPALFAACSTTPADEVTATEASAKSAQEGSADLQEKMMKAMALMGPGPEHAELAKWAGDFEVEMSMWMTPEATTPMKSSGTSHHEMVLGGRFLRMDATGTMMGMPTESFSMLGFDRRHERYTTVGFDTMGTYFVTAEGTYDEETKTLTMYGEDEDPVMDVTQKYDFVMTFIDDDTYKMELIFKPGVFGNEEDFKVFESTYRRVPAGAGE